VTAEEKDNLSSSYFVTAYLARSSYRPVTQYKRTQHKSNYQLSEKKRKEEEAANSK
jgi:hypothetical protein